MDYLHYILISTCTQGLQVIPFFYVISIKKSYLCPGAPISAKARERRRAEGAASQDHAGLLLRAEPAAAAAVRAVLADAPAAVHAPAGPRVPGMSSREYL